MNRFFLIGIILLLIVGVFFIFFYNSQDLPVLEDDIILTPIDLSEIDCNIDNLDRIITILDEDFICILLNDNFNWIKLKSDINKSNLDIDVTTSLEKEEIKRELSKTYVYENQKCTSRNISQIAYLVDTNIEMSCVELNGNYSWQISLDYTYNDLEDPLIDVNLEDPYENNGLNYPFENEVLDLNYENSMQDHECFFYEENSIFYDFVNDVNFICVYNLEKNIFNWTLLD